MDFISVIVSGAATSLSKQLLSGVLTQSLVVLISAVLVVFVGFFNHLFMYFVYIGVYSLESGLSFHSVQSQGLNLSLQSCQQTP